MIAAAVVTIASPQSGILVAPMSRMLIGRSSCHAVSELSAIFSKVDKTVELILKNMTRPENSLKGELIYF